MTKHMTGTREEWLAARLGLLEDEKEQPRRRAGAAAAAAAVGSGSTRRIGSTPMKAAPRWHTSSAGARSFSSTTSCSGPTTRAGCPSCSSIATNSTASPSTGESRRRVCGGVAGAAREAAGVQAADGGRFPGHPRPAATSTPTSTSPSPRSSSAREVSNTTTGARRRVARGPGGWRRGGGGPVRGHVRNRRGHVTSAIGRA